MSLSGSLFSALSGINTTQRQLQVVSNNVNNANVEGFSRRSAPAVTRALDGQAAGVEATTIKREVDSYLIRESRAALSAESAATTTAEYLSRAQSFFGTPGSDSSIAADINRLASEMQRVASTPESANDRTTLVREAERVARHLQELSGNVQDLRKDADRAMATSVDVVNDELSRIADLNDEISRRTAMGDTTAELEDQRDRALDTVAEHLDIRTLEKDTGEVVVMSSSGRVLVDQIAVELEFTPASTLGAAATGDSVRVSGVDLDLGSSGRLAALDGIRDQQMLDVQAEVDSLARNLASEINALHNLGTGSPPPVELQGTRTFADPATTPIALTGRMTIAFTDASGALNTSSEPPAEIDLSSATTLDQVVTAINGAFTGTVAAEVDGRLELTAPAGQRIAITESDGASGQLASATETQGLAEFFGLNDFFVFGNGPSAAGSIAVRSDISVEPGYTAFGQLDRAEALAATDGDIVVAEGDGRIAQRMAAAFQEDIEINAVGSLQTTRTTLAGYAGDIVASSASRTAAAENDAAFKTDLQDELAFRSDSHRGVNVDEELSNMILLQQSYQASARIISTVQEMFDVLDRAVR